MTCPRCHETATPMLDGECRTCGYEPKRDAAKADRIHETKPETKP